MRYVNVITLLGVLVVNFMASTLPINNLTTGQISGLYPVFFTPAGYVFSIWGLIYISLIAFSVYQALPAQRNNPMVHQIGGWFIVANIFNSAWIFAWHYLLVPLSMVLMLGLLLSLLMIYTRLKIGLQPVKQSDAVFINFPFSIYLGWISVATIANFSVLFYSLGWDGFGLSPEFWTALVISVGAALGILMIYRRKEIAYPLVITWAFAGILFKPESPQVVATTAGLAAATVMLFLLFSLLRARQMRLMSVRNDRNQLSG